MPVTEEEKLETDEVTLREAFMKAISGNPRFQEAKKSSSAFVIAGTPTRKERTRQEKEEEDND